LQIDRVHNIAFFSKHYCELDDEFLQHALISAYRQFYLRPSYVWPTCAASAPSASSERGPGRVNLLLYLFATAGRRPWRNRATIVSERLPLRIFTVPYIWGRCRAAIHCALAQSGAINRGPYTRLINHAGKLNSECSRDRPSVAGQQKPGRPPIYFSFAFLYSFSMSSKIHFIVNPHSAGGNTGRIWPEIKVAAEKALGPISSSLTAGRWKPSR